MDTLADAQRDLTIFGNVLARVRGEINAGTDVDLSGLPERTEALCRRLEALPRDEGKALLPLLSALVRESGALAERLTARHTHLVNADAHRTGEPKKG